jgi:lipoprotein-releasing system ATP-binding protein
LPDLVVQHLSKSYPTPGDPLVVLEDVSLELSLGENLAIVGPSGSGKSTLLQIIGTLDRPTSGTVRLQNQDPFGLPERELARFRNRRIGFVFQDHYLLPQLTAWENVLVPTLAGGRPSSAAVERAETLLGRVGLSSRRNHRPSELSGGERQRVAIARALIAQPLLLMADEPTGNLDRRTAESITDLLLELQLDADSPTMMIVVTHSAPLAQRLQSCRELELGRLV